MSDKSPISLTFQKIEEILGDRLPAEAYLYDAFWFESLPGMPSPLWREEGYPFHAIVADDIDYCISNAWSSQGYEIKSLSEILGHANTGITLDRYVHASMDMKRANMDKLAVVGL